MTLLLRSCVDHAGAVTSHAELAASACALRSISWVFPVWRNCTPDCAEILVTSALLGSGLIPFLKLFLISTFGSRLVRKVKIPALSVQRTDGQGRGTRMFLNYCAGAAAAGGAFGASAVTSGAVIGVIFTVERMASRRLKTLSRSTCLTMPSSDASVVTFRANS